MGPFDYPSSASATYGAGTAANPAYRRSRPPLRMPPTQQPPQNWTGGPMPPTTLGGRGSGGGVSGTPNLPPVGVGGQKPGQGWVDMGYGSGAPVNGFQRENPVIGGGHAIPPVENPPMTNPGPIVANDGGMGQGVQPQPPGPGQNPPYPPSNPPPITITGGGQAPMPPTYGTPYPSTGPRPRTMPPTPTQRMPPQPATGNPYAGTPKPPTYLG